MQGLLLTECLLGSFSVSPGAPPGTTTSSALLHLHFYSLFLIQWSTLLRMSSNNTCTIHVVVVQQPLSIINFTISTLLRMSSKNACTIHVVVVQQPLSIINFTIYDSVLWQTCCIPSFVTLCNSGLTQESELTFYLRVSKAIVISLDVYLHIHIH